ncbi:universal stress protein [Roseococcus sp. DSY-14]|uniref:universal stress protein n=1 Tax=Roseococcus sp. DSY-14 TaxID=3369650 RepID=UPI00387AC4FA
MLRSILLALDDTPGAQAARDLALALARRHGARLTALVVLDRPHTLDDAEPVPVGGSAFATRRNAALARAVEEEAARVLQQAREAAQGFSFTVERSEAAPEEALLAAGAAHDLLVIGRDSTLGREACDDGLAPVIEDLVRDGARPLLVVPPGPAPVDGPVLAAVQPGLASQRALHLFALLGLGQGRGVTVQGFGEDPAPIAAYLVLHGCDAQAVVAEGDPEAILPAAARALGAAMLVIGAEEEGGLSRLVFGSAASALLRAAPCPVFIHG